MLIKGTQNCGGVDENGKHFSLSVNQLDETLPEKTAASLVRDGLATCEDDTYDPSIFDVVEPVEQETGDELESETETGDELEPDSETGDDDEPTQTATENGMPLTTARAPRKPRTGV